MVPRLLSTLAILVSVSLVSAQQTCSVGKLCGSAAPCCSEFGFCGDGVRCLGGCNPLLSNSLTSCRPAPICEDENIKFTSLDRVLSNYTLYDGNATLHDFVVDKGNVFLTNENELVLTLTKENNGTRISSTRYLHYGSVTASIKTARSAGVVNAFITMSDVKDEIDWEWPGTTTTEVQSNFFWLGHVDYSQSNGETHGGLTDTYANYHDYTIDWQPEVLTWAIDGKVVRTVNKADTLSKDGRYYAYPTTPARIQFSIWPAGIPGNPQGTIDWAGGMIDWNDPDYTAQGQFSILVKSITVKCSKETAATNANGTTLPPDAQSYIYTTNDTQSGLVPRVYVSNASTNVNGGRSLLGVTAGVGVTAVTAFAVLLGVFALLV